MRFLMLVAVLLCLANVSRADWQYTKWGMTVDEVLTASRGQTYKVDGFKSELYEEKLNSEYSSGAFNFLAKFFFDPKEHGLVSVELTLKEPKKHSFDLADALISKYGQPFWDSSPNKNDLMLHHRKWKGEGNLIRLIQGFQGLPNTMVTLIYEPIPGTGGL